MKLQPLLRQYLTTLPIYTNLFSTNLSITSLTRIGIEATAITSVAHNLAIGDFVNITGAIEIVPLNSLTPINPLEIVGRTPTPHGLSLAMNFKNLSNNIEVTIENANEAEYNGTFPIVAVPNRFAFIAEIPNTNIPGTGGMRVFNYAYNAYNGIHIVTSVPNTTTFTYEIDPAASSSATGNPIVHTTFRMKASATLERAINFYTQQPKDEFWLFIVAGTSAASKDRTILNDSITTASLRHHELRQRLVEDYHVVIVAPTADDTSGANTFELLEDVKVALIKSMVRFPNETPFSAETDYVYTYGDAKIMDYNTSYLVYQFTFDTVFDITYDDMWNNAKFVPFLNIEQDQLINKGQLIANIDLDVDPTF